MVNAQARRNEICGVDNFHFCGAYWYNGFHEDGVTSALDVCARFGEAL
jgi:predicted NAD/FAD-binding protein